MINNSIDFPNDINIERQVLSACFLTNGNVIPSVVSSLVPDDFYDKKNKAIFQAIVTLFSNGTTPDLNVVIEHLKKYNNLSGDDVIYILQLGDLASTTAFVKSHINILKEKARLRHIIEAARFTIDDAQKGVKSTNEIIADSHARFTSFDQDFNQTNLIQIDSYFQNSIASDIDNLKLYADRSTGFYNIDQQQLFSPGLYVIGATPAAGKTTFCWQLLEQLAQNGEKCIYCSYEMSALELFTKSAARRLFLKDQNTLLTAAQIRRGGTSNALNEVFNSIANSHLDFHVLELSDQSIDDLLNILRPLCSNLKKAPVICLDYLQIIPQDNVNIKLSIDNSVRKLKKFQRDTNATFIVISSFNRNNYMQPVSFESFKESGNIEYSADVVWALQLNVINSIKNSSNIANTRNIIEEAKQKKPRHIHLKCLKNRQGSNYDCFFHYFAAHDFFRPCDAFVNSDDIDSVDDES